jgi:predicted  nucleic acid-binding Zn-ribbon protein
MNLPELALRHQRLDGRAAQLRAQIERQESELAFDPQVERLEREVGVRERAHRELEIRLRDREREVEARRARLRARERELMSGRISNPGELMRLSGEVEHLKTALVGEEDAELELMEEQERLEAEVMQLREQLELTRRRGEAAAPARREALSQLRTALAETEAEREETWRQLPADWQTAYRRVAGRIANPVAEVVGGECQACHVRVTSGGMQVLRRAGLLQCDNCGRLLVVA